MNPDTLDFTGNAVTYLGFVGVVSAFVIIVTAFRRFFNSPYNVRYVKSNATPADSNGSNSADCT
jgi:hypothetical protein